MADVMCIKEIDIRPLRSLEQVATGQAHLAELRRQAELYAAFQQLRDFLRKTMYCDDVTMQFDIATQSEGWRVLREAERF